MTESVTSAAVSLSHLTRTFGNVKALDDFSLDLAPGELVALLGPSGCGKTTALRALAGLEGLDSGTLVVGGRDVTRLPANRRDMAMVFQSYSLFPHLTVAGNIEFALGLRKVPSRRRAEAVAHNLELVGLGGHGDRYPHQLSGGQQQRVALARALAVRPQVLLLDEPLSALDAKVRVQLRDEIRRIQTEVGITTLFVTHDQEEALVIADRIGVMESGRLVQVGVPREIYSRPATPFVADFIGTTNALQGHAKDGVAHVLGQTVPLLPGSPTGPVSVLIRPESIALRPTADGAGTVVSTGFMGATSRVTVALADGTLVLVQLRGSNPDGMAPGQKVALDLASNPALARQVPER
jgi:putative spermidine/putrescine transport system ATP-binding protein